MDALIADAPDILFLLRERHIGLAVGAAEQRGLDDWAASWVKRLEAKRPNTWGEALGTDFYHLRWLLGDNHLRVPGEDTDLLRAVDRRGGEPVHGREEGPWLEERVVDVPSNPGGSEEFVLEVDRRPRAARGAIRAGQSLAV